MDILKNTVVLLKATIVGQNAKEKRNHGKDCMVFFRTLRLGNEINTILRWQNQDV